MIKLKKKVKYYYYVARSSDTCGSNTTVSGIMQSPDGEFDLDWLNRNINEENGSSFMITFFAEVSKRQYSLLTEKKKEGDD